MKFNFAYLTGWRLAAALMLAAVSVWQMVHGHASGAVEAGFLGLFGGDSSSSSTTTTETQQNPQLSSTGGSALTSSVGSGVSGTNVGTGATALQGGSKALASGAVDLAGASGTNYSVTYNVPNTDAGLLSGLANLGNSSGTGSSSGVQYVPTGGGNSFSQYLPYGLAALAALFIGYLVFKRK